MHKDDLSSFDLTGKTALVTGASGGLGKHFAEVLARNGARVILMARRKEYIDEISSNLTRKGYLAHAEMLDVNNTESISHALDSVNEKFGNIDILVNNAGVADRKSLLKIDEESWDFVVDTNLKAVAILSIEFAKRFKLGHTGSIINIASIYGIGVGIGNTAYACSKAGVIQLSKSMALELAKLNIRVNALCPGYFKTELDRDFFESEQGLKYFSGIPSKRPGNIEELNGALLLLSSEAGSYITGTHIIVDGGHLVKSI
jgi:NAD(P)-dependent dehydrogenase (short-subunit alcohol dehydrogenase family)